MRSISKVGGAARGKNRATVAVAHSMLIAIFHVLKGAEFRDLGIDYYTKFNKEKKINSYVKQLAKLGLAKLGVIIPDDDLRSYIHDAA